MRDNEEILTENRVTDFKAVTVDETIEEEKRTENIDYSKYENAIKELKEA